MTVLLEGYKEREYEQKRLTPLSRSGLMLVWAGVHETSRSFVCALRRSICAYKLFNTADRMKQPEQNPAWTLNDVISSRVSLLGLRSVTVCTRSFSFWSIVRIEPALPTPPPVSEMAVKSMGTNEIKLLGGSEEQMIFLWLITHCKRICARHITSESFSLPWLVSSG